MGAVRMGETAGKKREAKPKSTSRVAPEVVKIPGHNPGMARKD